MTQRSSQPARTRYAIVGTGSRATMYIDAICATHADHAEEKASGPAWVALYRKATVATRQGEHHGLPGMVSSKRRASPQKPAPPALPPLLSCRAV